MNYTETSELPHGVDPMLRTKLNVKDPEHSSPSLLTPSGWVELTRGVLPEPLFALGRYLLVLVLITGLGAIYIWQASILSRTYGQIQLLDRQASQLEVENIELMQQLVQWLSPAYLGTTDAK